MNIEPRMYRKHQVFQKLIFPTKMRKVKNINYYLMSNLLILISFPGLIHFAIDCLQNIEV